MIDQLRAVAIATRFLVTHSAEPDFREVWAVWRDGQWWVSFASVVPPNAVQSPAGRCVAVDAETGPSAWFETL